jgi:hypothetical protein
MERRFSMNDFEQSLKEHVDEFKMIPSKRVWHGIYNDLHPGRRWPSIAMSLSLVFVLIVIGYLDTHNGSQKLNSDNIPAKSQNVTVQSKTVEVYKPVQKATPQKSVSFNADISGPAVRQPKNVGSKPGNNSNAETNNTNTETIINNSPSGNNNLTADNLLAQNFLITSQPSSAESERNNIFFPQLDVNWSNIENYVSGDENTQSQKNTLESNETIKRKIVVNNSYNLETYRQIIVGNVNLKKSKLVSGNNSDKGISKNSPVTTDKQLNIEKQKRNDKISWVYFAAPQVNSVSFNGEPLKPLSSNNNSPVFAITPKDYKVLHSAALGFEVGAQMNYGLVKKLEFTAGLHITYSGYNIISNEVHPSPATLFLKDPQTGNVYSKSYITHYGDGTGQTVVSIRNYSLQASIPIGMQYELSEGNKVRFNTYANFAPSVVIKSNAYILSSDGKNYVNDPDLLRRLNMSSNFGIFVSFTSAKFKWQIGPNVRYQWLSTYKKDYTVKEHLIDYGIRLGISPIRK